MVTARRSGGAPAEVRANQRNALVAGFLGWTLDAFDFFVLTFVVAQVAHDFNMSVPAIALTVAASLWTRPIGAIIFGLMADRWGRRRPLMINILFYSAIAFLCGLAPNYTVFFVLRLLYGIGMGGEWGVGASLVMESVPVRWRGVLSGLLQMGYTCGYFLAAIVYYLVFPIWGWRAMFFVGGLPALLTLFVRAKVKETEAWQESRTDWPTYRRAIRQNLRLFAYLVGMMTIMAFVSHGTQDMYPTFLQRERHFSPELTAGITMISMTGAIFGGLLFGLYSDRRGRRRAMITALLLACVVVPLWVLAPSTTVIVVGAFLMQFMVQGAWGIVPAHINELAPNQLRGFFPGLAYQLGILFASSIVYIEAVLGEHFTYSQSMGLLAASVTVLAALVVSLGPEAKGVLFGTAAAVEARRETDDSAGLVAAAPLGTASDDRL
jgi:SHS family lactate transporter-like MFS transporter